MNDNFNDFYTAMIALVVALNSIAIPVSYNIIAENFKQYLDDSIYKDFQNTPQFRENIILSIIAIAVFAFPLFINFNLKDLREIQSKPYYENCRFIYSIITLFMVIGFLIGFFNFSKMLYQYSTNSQEVLFKKIQKDIDEFLK